MCKKIILIAFVVIPGMLFAQGEFVVNLNISDGTYVKTGTAISGVDFIYINDCTYDDENNIYYFPCVTPEIRLYSIDVCTNSIVYNPLYSNMSFFEYDTSTNKLYGILQQSATNTKQFVEIDPVLGNYTTLGATIPESAMNVMDVHTINTNNGTYIYLDPDNKLYSISLADGYIVNDPVIFNQSGETLLCFEMNNDTEVLYGLLQDSNNSLYYLVTIDPVSGTITKIGSGTSCGEGNACCAVDTYHGYFTYLYYHALGFSVTSMSLTTGAVIYNSLIMAFPTQDNFYSIVCDNDDGNYYCLHWDASSAGIDENVFQNLSVFPNPVTDEVFVNTDISGEKEIEVYNILGLKIISFSTYDKEIVINTQELKQGRYFLRLIYSNETYNYDFIKN